MTERSIHLLDSRVMARRNSERDGIQFGSLPTIAS